MADLHLNLKGEYFDAIKAGTKMHSGSSIHTAGAISEEQHKAIALILQGKSVIYEGEPCTS